LRRFNYTVVYPHVTWMNTSSKLKNHWAKYKMNMLPSNYTATIFTGYNVKISQ